MLLSEVGYVLHLDCGGGYRTVQAYQTISFKIMNFTVCSLYLSEPNQNKQIDKQSYDQRMAPDQVHVHMEKINLDPLPSIAHTIKPIPDVLWLKYKRKIV